MPLPTTINDLITWMAQNNLISPFTFSEDENRNNWYHRWTQETGFIISNGVVSVFGYS
jgi:hypothetical protein